jgi:hypothetical protein
LEGIITASAPAGKLQTPGATASSLEDLLLLCIDEVLADLLGRRTREAVYDNLERNYSLSRSEIPGHMNKFLGLLEETFGKGSKTIGKTIIKRMFDKLEWKFVDVPGYEFMDYLEAIRSRIARTLLEQAKKNSSSKIQ